MKRKKVLAVILSATVMMSMSSGLTVMAASAPAAASTVTVDSSRVSGGTVTYTKADGVTINDNTSGHEAFVLVDSEYTIKDSKIKLNTTADGSDTCDFSGTGAAVAAYSSDVSIENSTIETSGVATMPIFADSAVGDTNGSNITVKNSTLISNGGTLNKNYLNTPDQALMVAPPWILGIMGTSRCTNAMGQNTSMDFLDSDTQAGAWAVLSTDSGSNMTLNMYNTSLTLNNKDESKNTLQASGGQITTKDNPYTTNYGSGYGTYAIGSAVETFAGADVNVGTYAVIFTGGKALFKKTESGKTYTLSHADGSSASYTSSKSKVSTVNSDTFGFMFHQGENTLDLTEGTVVNSGYTCFLMKTGSSDETANVTVDDTTINAGNNVLIQVMDNDDATTGGMMDVSDPLNTNGGFMNFKPAHTENAGFNTALAEEDTATQNFTFTNGTYKGNIYNASGSDNSTAGSLKGNTLNVTLGKGATLTGAAASTAAIHVTKTGSDYVKNTLKGDAVENVADTAILGYQNTNFTISEYYDIGQVANAINDNGANDINITLSDDAVWNVDGTSVIDKLTFVGSTAKVVIADSATLTVGSKKYTGGQTTLQNMIL